MKKLNNSPFSDLIKSKRIALGLTQAELSGGTGISLRTITLIESEGHIPRSKSIDALKKALSISDEEWESLNIQPARSAVVGGEVGKITGYVNEGRDIRYLLQGMLDTSDDTPVSLSDIVWMLDMEKLIGVPIAIGTAGCIFSDKKSS